MTMGCMWAMVSRLHPPTPPITLAFILCDMASFSWADALDEMLCGSGSDVGEVCADNVWANAVAGMSVATPSPESPRVDGAALPAAHNKLVQSQIV